jgi:hypothetical protein
MCCKAITDRWGRTAPFGGPLVPDVKRMMAGWSSPAGGGGSSGSCVAARAVISSNWRAAVSGGTSLRPPDKTAGIGVHA